MAMDLNKPAVVTESTVPEYGRFFYEIHIKNVRRLQPMYSNLILPWEMLTANAQQSWYDSATEFLQQFSED